MAEKWLTSRVARRRARSLLPKAPDFVLTKSAIDFFGVFEHAQYTPDLAVISGGPGAGKTFACEAYRERTPNVWLLTAEPCLSSIRMLLTLLADVLGVAETRSTERLSRAIIGRVQATGGLLIVDEAQNLTTELLEQLRTVFDTGAIGITFVGDETVHARLEGLNRTAKYARLFSRVGMRLQRPVPAKRDIELLMDAWGVEGAPERRLLLAIARKPGALRGMTRCLRMAHMLAGAAGAEGVTEEHLLMAWQNLGNQPLDAAA